MATTSNSYSYVETASTLAFDAASKLGFLGESDVLTPSEQALIFRSINRNLKALMPSDTVGGSYKMWQNHRGFIFLSANSGEYILSSNSSYWTDSFLLGFSSGSLNPTGQTTLHFAATQNLPISPTNANNLTGNVVTGMNMCLVLDNGSMFYTTANVVTATTITIPVGIPASCNTSTNPCYFFATPAQAPQEIQQVVLRDNQGNDTAVKSLTYEEWFQLASKQAPNFSGDPVAFYYELHAAGDAVGNPPQGLFFTDVNQAQDLTKYLVVAHTKEIQDVVNPTDVIEVPKEYYLSILYEVAYDISDDFGVDWTPQKEKKRLQAAKSATRGHPKRSAMGFVPGNRGGLWSQGTMISR